MLLTVLSVSDGSKDHDNDINNNNNRRRQHSTSNGHIEQRALQPTQGVGDSHIDIAEQRLYGTTIYNKWWRPARGCPVGAPWAAFGLAVTSVGELHNQRGPPF